MIGSPSAGTYFFPRTRLRDGSLRTIKAGRQNISERIHLRETRKLGPSPRHQRASRRHLRIGLQQVKQELELQLEITSNRLDADMLSRRRRPAWREAEPVRPNLSSSWSRCAAPPYTRTLSSDSPSRDS